MFLYSFAWAERPLVVCKSASWGEPGEYELKQRIKDICIKSNQENEAWLNKRFLPTEDPYNKSMRDSLEEQLIGYESQKTSAKMSFGDSYFTEEQKIQAQKQKSLFEDTQPDLKIARALKGMGFVKCNTSVACTQIFNRIVDIVQFKNNMIMLKLFDEILFDQRYLKGIGAFQEIVAKKVKSVKENKIEKLGSLFDDGLNAMLSVGYSKEEAKEATLKVLAVISTMGPSFNLFYPTCAKGNGAQQNACLNLGLIASGMNVLDRYGRDYDQIYSLPEDLHSNCYYNRPYHFWLPAYLAHQLKQEKYSAQEIVRVLHDLQIIYKKYTPLNRENLDTESVFTNWQAWAHKTEIQKDMVYNDAGALWGLKLKVEKEQKNIVDEMLRRDQSESRQKARLKSSGLAREISDVLAAKLSKKYRSIINPYAQYPFTAQQIFDWDYRVAPDAHLELLLKSLEQPIGPLWQK